MWEDLYFVMQRRINMGCWNYQIFCDDTAMDALDELVNSENLLVDLEHFLDAAIALEEDYLEFDECQYGLVAASIVDSVLNGVDWSLLTDMIFDDDSDYALLLQKAKNNNLDVLRNKAITVIQLASKEDSELRELWEENVEIYPLWLQNLDTIKQRLLGNSVI